MTPTSFRWDQSSHNHSQRADYRQSLNTKLLFAWRHNSPVNFHGLLRFLTFSGRLVDCVHHFHSLRHCSKCRELTVEMWSWTNEDEKVCRGTIWLVGTRHRNNAAHVLHQAGLVREAPRNFL